MYFFKEIKTLSMKYKKLFFTLFLFNYVNLHAQTEDFTELNLNLDAAISDDMLSGAGKDKSFLSEGWKYTTNLNANLSGKKDELNYQFRLGLRSTNDKKVDKVSLSLTNAQGFMQYRDHKLILGDVFEVFSRYSLSSSMKGSNYRYAGKNNLSLSLIGGKAYSRWESWWKDPDALISIKRNAYGLNVKRDILPDMTFGLSYLQSEDNAVDGWSGTLYDNKVIAATLDYKPIEGLTLQGEAALSATDLTNAASNSAAGQAFRIEAVGDQDPSRVVLEYERVSPNFESMLGAAVKDRENTGAAWRYKANKNITLSSSMKYYRNSLYNAANRTNTYKPQIGANIRNLSGRRYSNLDLKLSMDYRDRKGKVVSDWFTSADYRDRFGIYDINTGLGLSSYNANKNDTDKLDTTARFSVSTRKTFGEYSLRPMLSASANYADDDEAAITRKIYEYSVGTVFDMPEYRLNINARMGHNFMKSPNAEADAFYFNAQLNYSPQVLAGSSCYIKYAVNDYNYQITSNSYDEKEITIGFNMPFQYKW